MRGKGCLCVLVAGSGGPEGRRWILSFNRRRDAVLHHPWPSLPPTSRQSGRRASTLPISTTNFFQILFESFHQRHRTTLPSTLTTSSLHLLLLQTSAQLILQFKQEALTKALTNTLATSLTFLPLLLQPSSTQSRFPLLHLQPLLPFQLTLAALPLQTQTVVPFTTLAHL